MLEHWSMHLCPISVENETTERPDQFPVKRVRWDVTALLAAGGVVMRKRLGLHKWELEVGGARWDFVSEGVWLFAARDLGATSGAGSAADDLHPPLKSVLALRSEIVDVRFEMQFEDVVFVNVFGFGGDGDRVAQQGQASKGVVILMGLVEKQAEVCEDHPQLLPAIAVLELPQQVAGQLILHGYAEVQHGHAGIPVPAHVHCSVAAVRRLSLQGSARGAYVVLGLLL